MADITTTTEEESEQMINPTEQKLQRYWDRIQRALQVLQKLDRYNVEPCSRMEWSKQGDWVDFCSVSKAIDILQEGQQ